MKIFRGINEILDLGFNPEGIERKELMVEHTVSFSFERSVYISLQKGDNILHNGKKFYLKDDYIPTVNKSTNGFVYDLAFYDIMERMKDIKLKYNGETDFKLTVTGGQFLDVVVSSFSGITKGSFPTDIKEIHFENVSVFDALNLITETYDTEWWLSGSTLNLSKCEFGSPVLLRQDTELDDISVSQSSETLVTRLYAKGSTRNIPKGYSQDNRLKLASGYVDLIPDLPESKIIEGVHIFEDIYPRQTTSIVEVIQGSVGDTPIFTIRGNNAFTITQNDVIPGQPLKIAFNTGNLAGREFELIIRADNYFEIKYIQDGELVIPNLTLKPEVGDEFFFFNFNVENVLPALIAQAENELLVAAQDYLDNLGSQLVYDCETRSIYCEQNVIDLAIGQVVTIQSENIGSVTTRIRAYEKQLLNSFECKYQAGDYSKYSRLKEIANRIKDSTPELQTLKSTLEYVFQDGIVTESELKSIEAILTNLSVERGQLNAQYLVVRGNVNLINKTPLETAWSNYQTAFVDVETAINNAITDKLISDAEKANIDNKISVYSTRTNEFATALENARVAIEDNKNQGVLDVVDQNKQYLQDQIDGVVDNWFYPYSPTLANYPASDWTTNTIKDRHIGDTFTNTAQAPATDAGKSWRFVVNAGVYSWTQIADSDAVLALQKAAQAQSTADGKSTTYLIQPTSYKLGDMWVLAADQTVNGVAYKSGEILTATQDSTTYNQAHWLKRVRYTDDTAVNNLEIGGRNLIKNSSEEWVTVTTTTFPYIDNFFPETVLEAGQEYTFSWEAEEVEGVTTGKVHIGCGTTGFQMDILNGPLIIGKGKVTFTPTASHLTSGNKFAFRWYNSGAVSTFRYRKLKLEKGNKATDWTPAPEDVQANIATAKTEAESAAKDYADTKAEAERVLAEAYADGKVTAEEQARIDDVNAKLAAAKAYAEAQDALLKTQQEAYADGKISTAEQAAINAAKDYADLKKTEAQAYADGIVSAEEARAIADALDKFNASKAHAETLVNNIEIGGRNLLKGTTDGWTTLNMGTWYYVQFFTDTEIEVGETYTFSVIIEKVSNDSVPINVHLGVGTTSYQKDISDWRLNNIEFGKKVVLTKTLTAGDLGTHKYFAWRIRNEQQPTIVRYKEVKLEKGNKATDWSPAPEDVQAAIDAEKTRINDILSDNVADPSEKQYLSNLWQEIYAEYPRIWAQANTYSVDKSNYEAKYSALNTLLSPVLANLTVNTTVSGASIRTAFSQYYDARTFLLNNITNKVNQNAGDAKLTAEQAQLAADGYMRARYVRDWVSGNSVNFNNQWNEIRIINKSGTNLAQGKSVEANGTISTPANVTDNVTTTGSVILNSIKTDNWVKIDLGQIYYDIDYIQVWHYYLDGRTYYGTKTEISTDGVNWTPVFDSAKSGTYKETAAGNIISLRPHEVLAKVLRSAATTDKFSGFDGGLATAVIMEMREPSTTTRGDATAGISGIQKDINENSLPAVWTGGTYAQAVAGTAKTIDNHDGSGHRAGGKLSWDAAGNLTVEGTVNAIDGEFTGMVKGNAGYFEGLVRIPFVETYNQTAWWGDESGFHPIITNPAIASTNVIARNQPGAGRTTVKLPTVINGYRIAVFNGETADNGSINSWGKIEISAGTKQILNANYGFTTDVVDQYNDQPGTISVLTGRSNPISANSMVIDFGEYVELVGVGTIGWIVTNRLKAR